MEMEQRFDFIQLMVSEYVARCIQISLEDAVETFEALKK